MNSELLNLGALAAIFALFVREFFAFMKGRNNGSGNGYVAKTLCDERVKNYNARIDEIKDDMKEMKNVLVRIESNHMSDLGKMKDDVQEIMRFIKR